MKVGLNEGTIDLCNVSIAVVKITAVVLGKSPLE